MTELIGVLHQNTESFSRKESNRANSVTLQKLCKGGHKMINRPFIVDHGDYHCCIKGFS